MKSLDTVIITPCSEVGDVDLMNNKFILQAVWMDVVLMLNPRLAVIVHASVKHDCVRQCWHNDVKI